VIEYPGGKFLYNLQERKNDMPFTIVNPYIFILSLLAILGGLGLFVVSLVKHVQNEFAKGSKKNLKKIFFLPACVGCGILPFIIFIFTGSVFILFIIFGIFAFVLIIPLIIGYLLYKRDLSGQQGPL
jgi:hypothetical protein